MREDKLICPYMEVFESEIVNAIREKNLTTFDEVSRETGAGKFCYECTDDINEVIEKSLKGKTGSRPGKCCG